MTLSALNITTLVTQKTLEHLLSNQTFKTLSTQCLNMEPVLPIEQKIIELLVKQTNEDKRSIRAKLETEAIRAQQEQDDKVAIEINRAEKQDTRRGVELSKQISVISNNLGLNSTQMENTKQKIEVLDSRIDSIEDQIDLEKAKSSSIITTQVPSPNIGNMHGHPVSPVTQHAHPSITNNRQGQPFAAVVQRGKSGDVHIRTNKPVFSAELDRLQRELYRLKVVELAREKSTLDNLGIENGKLETSLSQCKNELSSTLPRRQIERYQRDNERLERQKARDLKGPLKQQLLNTNLERLEADIDKQHARINVQQLDLATKSKKLIYNEFLTELERRLPTLQLKAEEKIALNGIISSMRDYMSKQALMNQELAHLSNAQQESRELEEQLSRKEHEVVDIKKQTPQLAAKNTALTTKIRNLGDAIADREDRNNGIIVAGSVFLGLTTLLVVAPFVFPTLIMLFSILVFIPAAIAALTSLGLFTTAVVLAVKNSFDRSEQINCQRTIFNDSQAITQQSSKLNNILEVGLPDLRKKIDENIKSIAKIQANIKTFRTQADDSLEKAKKTQVDVVRGSEMASSFLAAGILPSAPNEGVNPMTTSGNAGDFQAGEKQPVPAFNPEVVIVDKNGVPVVKQPAVQVSSFPGNFLASQAANNNQQAAANSSQQVELTDNTPAIN